MVCSATCSECKVFFSFHFWVTVCRAWLDLFTLPGIGGGLRSLCAFFSLENCFIFFKYTVLYVMGEAMFPPVVVKFEPQELWCSSINTLTPEKPFYERYFQVHILEPTCFNFDVMLDHNQTLFGSNGLEPPGNESFPQPICLRSRKRYGVTRPECVNQGHTFHAQ